VCKTSRIAPVETELAPWKTSLSNRPSLGTILRVCTELGSRTFLMIKECQSVLPIGRYSFAGKK
jgi:hypothetical protein